MNTRRRIAVIIALVAAGTLAADAPPQRGSEVPALPAAEVFVQQPGLKISLHLRDTTLHVGRDPRFRVRFENEGPATLYLNPHVPSNLHLATTDEQPAATPVSYIARHTFLAIRASDLVRLEPGRSWEAAVFPEHTGGSGGGGGRYAEHVHTKESGWALLVPPGEYVARFTYINAPDYFARYDPYDVPGGVWEGRIETAPVRFTVLEPTPEQLAADLRRLSDAEGRPMASLLPAAALPADRLIERFKANPPSRRQLLLAFRAHPAPVTRRLLDILATMPPKDLGGLLYSLEFSLLIKERADCRAVTWIALQVGPTGGGEVTYLAPVFERAAPSCDEAREPLRLALADANVPPPGRATAAALLGVFRNASDVPLLIDALERKLPGIPAPSMIRGDPIAGGAVRGLAAVGGTAARHALARALADERRNSLIGPELAAALGQIGGDEVVQRLIAALSSLNPNIVLRAIMGLEGMRAQAAIPALLGLLRHRNATLRSYAAGALSRMSGAGLQKEMRAALGDRDENVQQHALSYLTRHGDASDLERFLTALGSHHQGIREMAREGIRRFGTASTFPRVRALLDKTRPDVSGSAAAALSALTFVDDIPPRTPAQWDLWYATHRGVTRTEWAREALRVLASATPAPRASPGASVTAVMYLADQKDTAIRDDFERAARSRLPVLRVEAAKAIAQFDRRRAARLLIREFDSRLLSACHFATDALNGLLARTRRVECTDPVKRARAKEAWRDTMLNEAAMIPTSTVPGVGIEPTRPLGPGILRSVPAKYGASERNLLAPRFFNPLASKHVVLCAARDQGSESDRTCRGFSEFGVNVGIKAGGSRVSVPRSYRES